MPPLDLALVAHQVVRADGQGRVMLELARAAAEAGHRVTVYAWRMAEELPVRWSHIPGPLPGPLALSDALFVRETTSRVRTARHEVVCVKGPCAFPATPYVYYGSYSPSGWRAAWGREPPDAYKRVYTTVSMHRERRCLSRASAAIAVSGALARDFGLALDSSAHKPPVHVVPNGVDLREFPLVTPAARAEARARFGLSPDDFVIGFAGEFRTRHKGLEHLARAVEMSGDPRERLVVAGDGPPGRLAGLAASGRAVVVGRVVPANPVFAASDVVVVPSAYDAFSLVALEAAASGIPIALSSRCGVTEHLAAASMPIDDPTNPGAVRAAIDRVKADPDGARVRAAVARKIAERLSWRATGQAALAVLEAVAARQGARSRALGVA